MSVLKKYFTRKVKTEDRQETLLSHQRKIDKSQSVYVWWPTKKTAYMVQEQIHYWALRARISNRRGVYSRISSKCDVSRSSENQFL